MGDYVNGFSLVLGVYMFGLQGLLLGPALVCGGKLLYELGGSIIHEAEGLVTPSHDDIASREPSPPHHQPPQQQHFECGGCSGNARSRQAEAVQRSDSTRGPGRAPPSTARRPSRHHLEELSKGLEHSVSQAMRRLSFLSPAFKAGRSQAPSSERTGAGPAASPAAAPSTMRPRAASTGLGPLRNACEQAESHELAESPAPFLAHSRSMHPACSCSSHEAACVRPGVGGVDTSASVWVEAAVEGGEVVRVGVPAGTSWPDFLQAVSTRLRAVSELPAAHPGSVRAIALRDTSGALVASVDDLRCGERLVVISGESSRDNGGSESSCGLAEASIGAAEGCGVCGDAAYAPIDDAGCGACRDDNGSDSRPRGPLTATAPRSAAAARNGSGGGQFRDGRVPASFMDGAPTPLQPPTGHRKQLFSSPLAPADAGTSAATFCSPPTAPPMQEAGLRNRARQAPGHSVSSDETQGASDDSTAYSDIKEL